MQVEREHKELETSVCSLSPRPSSTSPTSMDDLIELEDYCVFCSKYLAGTHEFNKKMHFNTCKLRKLFDSVYTKHTDTSDMDQFFMGDSCSFCLKSLKDFKSEFNKRIHVKCCKIKKETFERRDSILQLQHSQSAAASPASLLHSLTEACIFCAKPLGNLNSFNRKMHIEHCKIRKSLEGNIRSAGSLNKDQASGKQGASSGNTSDIGDHCVYCNKSFARLSDFNRRLHSEHCKSKKRKLKTLNNVINSSLNLASLQAPESSLDQVQNSLMLLASNSCPTTPLRGSYSLNGATSSEQSAGQDNSLTQSQIGVAVCDYCEYCSRSLANLSNFNKNIHIEQCKLKQLKKAGNGLKQANKPPRKKAKTSGKDKSVKNEFPSKSHKLENYWHIEVDDQFIISIQFKNMLYMQCAPNDKP
ncbi:hypothetical protein BpHYR1_002558 [Brachionus plicatilis]|uniref:Uncharacterized protein n=1 Tax=Brachionus plicatilis TaxID=10195 RepID=A0A3M7RGB6_BRAPC|nr:hypothetical protein BpHYR1_002558 [Brachionus plicatilis]